MWNFMENDKKYAIRVWLTSFTVKHNDHHRAITPDTYRITNGKFETDDEERAVRKAVYDEFGALLDAIDSDNPIKRLEDLYWDNKDPVSLEVGRVTYECSFDYETGGHTIHNMSHEKYLELGKPKALDITRVCEDTVIPVKN